jgi:hypothetical protein
MIYLLAGTFTRHVRLLFRHPESRGLAESKKRDIPLFSSGNSSSGQQWSDYPPPFASAGS